MLSQLPMYQKKGAKAYSPNLSRMKDFCQYLNQPQDQIKTLHVAGTNGKGSTAHIMASVLQQHGYQVGLYTSPHLKDFRERIKINGIEVSKDWVSTFVSEKKNIIQEVLFFTYSLYFGWYFR